MTITGLSVAVALVIGTIEIAGLIASQVNLAGSFWSWFENININLLGFIIVGMFVATWAIAFVGLEVRAHRGTLERAPHLDRLRAGRPPRNSSPGAFAQHDEQARRDHPSPGPAEQVRDTGWTMTVAPDAPALRFSTLTEAVAALREHGPAALHASSPDPRGPVRSRRAGRRAVPRRRPVARGVLGLPQPRSPRKPRAHTPRPPRSWTRPLCAARRRRSRVPLLRPLRQRSPSWPPAVSNRFETRSAARPATSRGSPISPSWGSAQTVQPNPPAATGPVDELWSCDDHGP